MQLPPITGEESHGTSGDDAYQKETQELQQAEEVSVVQAPFPLKGPSRCNKPGADSLRIHPNAKWICDDASVLKLKAHKHTLSH